MVLSADPNTLKPGTASRGGIGGSGDLEEMIVSIVMPAYRLAGRIEESIRRVEEVASSLGLPYEIIVIDDGSDDGTYTGIQRASDGSRVRGYRLERNSGKGAALRFGFSKSRGQIVVFFDADLDISPRQIKLLVETLMDSGADMVVTSKWHPDSATDASLTRTILSKGFYMLAKVLLGLKVSDTQTGAKAFRRKVLEDVLCLVKTSRYAFDVELITAAYARGYRAVEVPALWRISLRKRFSVREILVMLEDLIRIAWRHRVKNLYRRGKCEGGDAKGTLA